MGLTRRMLLGGAGALVALPTVAKVAKPSVDIALLFAIDASGSVGFTRLDLQLDGYARAFTDREVVGALLAGPHRAVAVAIMCWASESWQAEAIGWRQVASVEDAANFAATIDSLSINPGGGTSIGAALEFGRNMLRPTYLPYEPLRRVIDISGDGKNNRGKNPEPVRDLLVKEGIVINGLPILNKEPDVERYYRRSVVGGPGSFVRPAQDYESFGEALRSKIIQEVAMR